MNIDQYSEPGEDGLKGTSGQTQLLNKTTVTCNISFRDQQDKIIALPASYTISAKGNLLLLLTLLIIIFSQFKANIRNNIKVILRRKTGIIF